MLLELHAVASEGAVLRRIDGRGHFWSCDKDGGNTIRSTIFENPLLYANFTLSSAEPELYPIDFFCIVEIENFAYFCEK